MQFNNANAIGPTSWL